MNGWQRQAEREGIDRRQTETHIERQRNQHVAVETDRDDNITEL